MTLRETLIELAAQTWRRLGQAHDAGLFWQEETNTETLLLTLAERHPRQALVQAVPRTKESEIGADWEWWIGSPGHWVGLRVQAKRLKFPNERFGGIFYRPKKGQPLQIETLIQRAYVDRLTPAYCFYVSSRKWPELAYWPSRHMDPSEPTPLGCLMAHASAVLHKKSTTLPKVAQTAFPWHLLAEPEGGGRSWADNVVRLMRHSCASLGVHKALAAGPGRDWPLFEPVAHLPPHAQALLHRARGEIGGGDVDLIREAGMARKIGGVVLISSVPLD